MRCSGCGAPMRLVRERDWFECDHCGAFHFPSPSDDGVRRLGELSDQRCDRCHVALEHASVEAQRVVWCPRCEGMSVPKLALGRIVTQRVARRRERVASAAPLDPAELRRRRCCAQCGAGMATHVYGGGGAVVIDTCERCAVVWLDRDELTRIVRAL